MSGLFSAVMIGLGRAVGETMIVLMAAGNTPILDWNIFNGFRTLSANIAVELPEAVRNSTHYRTLFLAALVLFVMTFVLNTVAEIVRHALPQEGGGAVSAAARPRRRARLRPPRAASARARLALRAGRADGLAHGRRAGDRARDDRRPARRWSPTQGSPPSGPRPVVRRSTHGRRRAKYR